MDASGENIISVSASGTSVANATGTDVLFTTKYPFTKLDSTSNISFQTIALLFNTEPPQPVGLGDFTNTLVYQFPHGYNYIPSIWLMWSNPEPESPALPSLNNSATTFYAFGDDTGTQAYINNVLQGSVSQPGTSAVATVAYNSLGVVTDVTDAFLVTFVDPVNVSIYLFKQCNAVVGSSVIPVNVAGISLNIRCYVFVEELPTS